MKKRNDLLLGLTVGVLAATAGYLAGDVNKKQLKNFLNKWSLKLGKQIGEEEEFPEELFENEEDIFEDED